MKKSAIYAALFLSFMGIAYADHPGPERTVDGKYTVSLTVIPEDNYSIDLIFFFTDARTGEMVSDIDPMMSVTDPGRNLILDREPIEVTNGWAELKYTFPSGGLFDISVEFEKLGEPGRVYRPEGWSLRVPGEGGTGIGSNYSIGLSDLVSLGVAGVGALLVAWSFIHNRKKR